MMMMMMYFMHCCMNYMLKNINEIGIKSNATTHNVRILRHLKPMRGGLQYGDHHGNCSAVAIMLAYCVFNTTSAASSLQQPLPSR